MLGRFAFVAGLAIGCSSAEEAAPPRAETTAAPPTVAPVAPPIADAGRVPFDLHVVDRARFDAEDRAWVDLARTGFVDLPAAFQLRARPLALPGVSLVQLGAIADPDGRSATSYFPTALVTRARSGEWRFVHVRAELPPGRPDTPAAPATDTRLSIRECAADAEPAILAQRIVDRGPILAERCESIDARVAAAILAQRDPDFAVRVFLETITEAMIGGRSFRIVTKRSDLDRDVRWLPGAAFGPWNVARSADALDASGLILFNRTWYRFTLHVASRITLEAGAVALEDSHGVPP